MTKGTNAQNIGRVGGLAVALGIGAALAVPDLPYGQYQAGGGTSCNSEPSGMRCSNSDGRGFSLSRDAYQIS